MPHHTVRDVMTPNPVAISADASLVEAARAMRQQDIGAVVVTEHNRMCGIVTDRDLVVRGLAEGRIEGIRTGDLCSRNVATVAPDSPVEEAIRLMRERAIRRLLVVEGGEAVGIVSLGDLAISRDRESVLGRISAAPPNK